MFSCPVRSAAFHSGSCVKSENRRDPLGRQGFLSEGALFAKAPSGSGFQVSLYGLAGILLAAEEGLEVNVLGLNVGLDAAVPALKLPAIGRLGLDR